MSNYITELAKLYLTNFFFFKSVTLKSEPHLICFLTMIYSSICCHIIDLINNFSIFLLALNLLYIALASGNFDYTVNRK